MPLAGWTEETRIMAEQQTKPPDSEPKGSAPGGGETFKREGPAPATHDTGRDVNEMNEKAAESVIRNERPDEATD